MYFSAPVTTLPVLEESYEIRRSTTWRCADDRNILVFIKEGECFFERAGQKELCQKGDILFLPAEETYTRSPSDSGVCTMIYLHFVTKSVPEAIDEKELSALYEKMESKAERLTLSHETGDLPEDTVFLSSRVNAGDQFERFSKQFDKVISDPEGRFPYQTLYRSLFLTELLADVSRLVLSDYRAQSLGTSLHYPVPLQKALLYVRANYKEKITVSDLGREGNVTSQHMIRLFRQYLGTTPIRYINKTKILRAVEMLRTTELSVKEIAYELGVDNPNYFSRMFKKEEGVSPAARRKRIRNFKAE